MSPPKTGHRWSAVEPISPSSTPHDAASALACWSGNLLDDAMPAPEAWPAASVVARSGSLARGGDPFAEDPRNWMPSGRRALEEALDRLVGPLASTGRTLLLRPHARQVLSDLAGCADFLRRHRGERFGIALAPADLLVPSMLPQADELLVRAFEVLVPRLDPSRDLLILQDLVPGDGPDVLPVAVPLGEGVLPWQACRSLLGRMPMGLRIALDPAAGADVLKRIWG